MNNLSNENWVRFRRADTDLNSYGNGFYPIAVVETIQKPEYNKQNNWNVTVVTDEKDVMIRFYLLTTQLPSETSADLYRKQIYGAGFDQNFTS